jgi:hypothetical protein
MIVDEYDEDWNRHRLVMIHGSASIALAENRNPVIAITPTQFVSWGRFG